MDHGWERVVRVCDRGCAASAPASLGYALSVFNTHCILKACRSSSPAAAAPSPWAFFGCHLRWVLPKIKRSSPAQKTNIPRGGKCGGGKTFFKKGTAFARNSKISGKQLNLSSNEIRTEKSVDFFPKRGIDRLPWSRAAEAALQGQLITSKSGRTWLPGATLLTPILKDATLRW